MCGCYRYIITEKSEKIIKEFTDMDKKQKKRIIIIGNYMQPLKEKLRHRGIITEDIIQGCNPLAMCGAKNIKDEVYCNSINSAVNTLNIRKNLDAVLSRDPKEFCDNTLFLEMGEERRYANKSDYILICNTMLAYKIFMLDNIVYSDIWPQNEFISAIVNNKNTNSMTAPFNPSFNWKYYYNKFIDCVMKSYDKDHIILVKTNISHWFINENNDIDQFNNNSLELKNFMDEADSMFEERTHCVTIEDMFAFVPRKKCSGALPNSQMADDFFTLLTDKICEIIENPINAFKKRKIYSNYIAKKLNMLFTNSEVSDKVSEYIEENWITRLSDIDFGQIGFDEVKSPLLKLAPIIENKLLNDFADYYIYSSADNSFDASLISDYCKFCRCTLSDLLCFWKLKSYITATDIIEICSNREYGVISYVINNVDRNIRFLENYGGTSEKVHLTLKETSDLTSVMYFKLKNDLFLVLDQSDTDKPIRTEKIDINKSIDVHTIIENLNCTIDRANTLVKSLSFYIQRAKEGKAGVPISIVFNSDDEVIRSLFLIDYPTLISNENFIVKFENETILDFDYIPRTDLTFVFSKNTKIVYITAGLSDQICYYLFSKKLQEKTLADIYYDDLYHYENNIFNGIEIDKISTESIDDKLITNILSPALLSTVTDENFADLLYKNGLYTIGAISCDQVRYKIYKNCPRMFFPAWPIVDLTSIFDNSFNFTPSYYSVMMRPEWLSNIGEVDVRKYIDIKPFDDDENRMYHKLITECDSIVLHIRRGDFVSLGWDTDFDYYKESLEKLESINDYFNKAFFVFSDDIPWCIENIEKTGLTEYFPNAKVYYVDCNKGEDSYKDMLLMTYSKVIIGSNSGFVRMAAYLSQTCEIFMCYNLQVMSLFEEKVRKNKYDIGSYKKNYTTDYSSKSPKK